jgi:hypothetical protein
MLKGDLKTFIDYFRKFAEAHPDLTFFCFGSVEKGISFARSFEGFGYPLLWLEEPIIHTTDNGASHVNDRFSVGVSVLITAPGDESEAQIDAYAQSLQIITDLQAKLRKDRKAGLINIELEGQKKFPVSSLWMDSHYGFRLEFFMDMNINFTIYGS